MRARVAALFTALLTAAGMLAVSAPGPASAQSPFPGSAAFSGWATGSTMHVDAVQAAAVGPRLANVDLAFSGASANSQGIGTAINSEVAEPVQPAKAGFNSYGRGTGIELGLGVTLPNTPDANQAIIAGLAEQSATPPTPPGDPALGGLVQKTVGPVKGDPLIYASALEGDAKAVWNNNVCIFGQPMGFGKGFAADAELLDAGTANPTTGVFSQPVVATDTLTGQAQRAVSESRSFTYLKPNGDGTFGLVSEVHETIAPVTIGKGMAGGTTIEFLGEWILRATATGKPGGAKVEYAPAGQPTPSTPVIQLLDNNGTITQVLKFQDIFGKTGLTVPANPLISIGIAENARAIQPGVDPDPTKAAPTAANGTSASGAVDVVRTHLLQPNDPNLDIHVADLRVGHMEVSATVPEGGIQCNIPSTKVARDDTGAVVDTVNAGKNFSFQISIPSSANALAGVACDLAITQVVDNVTTDPTTPNTTFQLTGADNGGTPSPLNTTTKQGTVTWNFNPPRVYHPGDSPILLNIQASIPGNSAAGVINDLVTESFTLTNCTGGPADGQVKTAVEINSLVKSLVFLRTGVGGPKVAPATLAATGEQPWIPVVGGGLLLGAMALWRGRRRLHAVRVKQ